MESEQDGYYFYNQIDQDSNYFFPQQYQEMQVPTEEVPDKNRVSENPHYIKSINIYEQDEANINFRKHKVLQGLSGFANLENGSSDHNSIDKIDIEDLFEGNDKKLNLNLWEQQKESSEKKTFKSHKKSDHGLTGLPQFFHRKERKQSNSQQLPYFVEQLSFKIDDYLDQLNPSEFSEF